MNALYPQIASGSQNSILSIKTPGIVQVNHCPPMKSHLFSVAECPKRDGFQYENPQYGKRISRSYSETADDFHNMEYTLYVNRMTYTRLSGLVKEKITEDNKDDEVFKKLKSKIQKVYDEHQEKNWDGYEAQPLKWLPEALKFADMLFQESRDLVESVDIVPENDGCLCFEWFKSDTRLISIAVKGDTLIYNCRIGDAKGCGEVNFFGSQILIDQIKRVAGGDFWN